MALDVSRARIPGGASGLVAWILVGAVALAHYVIVWKCAVNVPYWDEWEAFGGVERLPDHLSWDWLLTQHNEHRILFTRLQTWLLFKFNGWDIATQIRMNFVIFLGMVGYLTWMVHRAVPAAPQWFLALCFLSQITDLAAENHVWGFQSQFHITLLGLMVSVSLLFCREISWRRVGVGLSVLLLSIYSFSAGLAGSAALVVAFVGYRALLWRDDRATTLARECALIGVVVCIWAVAVYVYLRDHGRNGPALMLPNDLSFWDFFAQVISLGFGFSRVVSLPGIVCFTLVVGTVLHFCWLMVRRRASFEYSDGFVRLLILALVVLAALASISAGRARMGLGLAKSSRYAEIASILVPCVVSLWFGGASVKRRVSLAMAIVLMTLSAYGMRNNFRFVSDYPAVMKQREAGLRCVRRTLERRHDHGVCPGLYPMPIEDRILYAESRGASFIDAAWDTKNRR